MKSQLGEKQQLLGELYQLFLYLCITSWISPFIKTRGLATNLLWLGVKEFPSSPHKLLFGSFLTIDKERGGESERSVN